MHAFTDYPILLQPYTFFNIMFQGKGVDITSPPIFDCPVPVMPRCAICPGSAIENPDAVIMINGVMLTCGGEVQAAGNARLIAPEVCPLVQQEAKETCGCFAPVCDICDGYPMLNGTGIVIINGSVLTCAEAQDIGNAGLIASNTCSIIQDRAVSACGCFGERRSAMPSTSPSDPKVGPTAVPTLLIPVNIIPAENPNGPTGPTPTPPTPTTRGSSAASRTSGMTGILLLALLTWVVSL
jgi:hypothetical protein